MGHSRHIRIGVTGHRQARLDGVDLAVLEARVGALFDAIGHALCNAASGEHPQIEIVTCLAEGADSIAARCAMARGWRFEAVLPFPAAIYADDFPAGEPRDRFDAELAAAHRVFALNCSREGEEADTLAYERAGRVVLAQCDVMVGIWDGGPARGRGGTSQIIAEAVGADIPVIHLDPRGLAPEMLLWSGLNAHDLGEETVDTVARASIDQLGPVLAALAGIDGRAPGLEEAPLRPRLARLLGLPYAALLGVTRAKGSGSGNAGADADLRHDALAARFIRADRQASEAAGVFRGAYVANFGFAAMAVLVSLSGLVLPIAFKPLLLATELGLIGAILAITHFGNRLGWHRRWIEQRQLAERLRCLAIATRLGNLDLRAHGAGTSRGVQAEACVLARRIGLPNRTADDAWLGSVRSELLAMVADQRGYFRREAQTMHRLDHRLHRAGSILFVGTALVCIGFLAVEAALHVVGGEIPGESAHTAALYVTIATAAFPALGAAIYGIRMQGDFAGVAERGHAMEVQLGALHAAIASDPPDFDTLLTRTRRATALLTEDLASWTHAYHARPLVLPG
ncbi:hypothetical protein [Novosphingobium lentum]|uniref:hypothetical protein n=1 Tax=Novosphingobium lentum TaxID=145287 RepID=UPI00082BF990|nr:hypothetical protein [Novosphingobium lentum]